MNRKNRIDKLIRQLTVYKIQLMTAGVMLVLAAGPITSAYFYVPKVTGTDAVSPAAVLPESTWQAETTRPMPETGIAKEEYMSDLGELNLAHVFPDGADQSKMTESLAGQAFKVLMTRDEQWMSRIYDMADASPLQMANALGLPRTKVLGKYNDKDESHDIKDPDSWTINSFKKVRMSFTNGDGVPVSAYSNVIDIMSMANTYTYYNGVDDYDLFLSYSQALWEKSHSYTAGISDIYYCDGCMDEDAERREYEELEAEARAEEAGYVHSDEEREKTAETSSESPLTESAAAESSSAVIMAGATKSAPAETTAAPPPETVPESTSGVIVAGQAAKNLTEETPASEISETSADEKLSEYATPADAKASEARTALKCPGHIDLIVNVKVAGLKEKNGLFQLDSLGNDRNNIKEGGWPGWTQDTMESARALSSQDWFEKYGLSLSFISMMNPLTEAEIDAYMNQLPAGISQTRRDLIHFALSSVGKVPYYWGGKASSPNYSGNSFGVMTAPDVKGRILKGLDCSGWINWVYWSVTGQRLPYESTSGLAISGTRISRSELQPGDIIVRTGADAHVIMFLGWTSDGKIRCIHESSAGVNNVMVAVRDANWPYYRRLAD